MRIFSDIPTLASLSLLCFGCFLQSLFYHRNMKKPVAINFKQLYNYFSGKLGILYIFILESDDIRTDLCDISG